MCLSVICGLCLFPASGPAVFPVSRLFGKLFSYVSSSPVVEGDQGWVYNKGKEGGCGWAVRVGVDGQGGRVCVDGQ